MVRGGVSLARLSKVVAERAIHAVGGGFHLHTIHMSVEEVSRVLIHSGSMNLVWFFTGTKILSREKSQVGGGLY